MILLGQLVIVLSDTCAQSGSDEKLFVNIISHLLIIQLIQSFEDGWFLDDFMLLLPYDLWEVSRHVTTENPDQLIFWRKMIHSLIPFNCRWKVTTEVCNLCATTSLHHEFLHKSMNDVDLLKLLHNWSLIGEASHLSNDLVDSTPLINWWEMKIQHQNWKQSS